MRDHLFISYANEDLPLAKKIADYLEPRNIRCWLAPKAIEGGDAWLDELSAALDESAVFLLVWTKSAAASRWVRREILAADNQRLEILPLGFERGKFPGGIQMILEPLQTKEFSRTLNPEELATIEKDVRKRFAHQGIAPYPFYGLLGATKEEASLSERFRQNLEAIRLLFRFVALLHSAKYVQQRCYTKEANQAVERVFKFESFFVDMEIAHELMELLEGQNAGITASFGELFSAAQYNKMTGARFESSDSPANFDRENVHRLFGKLLPIRSDSKAKPADSEEWCQAMEEFLARALTQGWVGACSFWITAHGPGGVTEKLPVEAAENLRHLKDSFDQNATLSVKTPSEEIPLSPFFRLIRARDGNGWEIGLLRDQNDMANFVPLTLDGSAPVPLPPIILPWDTLEARRVLPSQIFDGECYPVKLCFANRSERRLDVQDILDRLPGNLVTADEGRNVQAIAPFSLEAGKQHIVEYFVRGRLQDSAWQRNYDASQSVRFFDRGEERVAEIQGDHEVNVKTLPPPTVAITQRFCDAKGTELTEQCVLLDAKIIVETTIRSAGAPSKGVAIELVVKGGVIIDGSSRLHQGDLKRVDLQSEIRVKTALRVTGRKQLTITPRVTGNGKILVLGQERILTIEDLPPPAVELRWRKVERVARDQGRKEIAAEIAVSNAGGTTAYDLKLSHSKLANAVVNIEERSAERSLASGQEIFIPIRMSCSGVPSGELQFTLTWLTARGESCEQSLRFRLDRVIQWTGQTISSLGCLAAVSEIESALTEAAATLTCVWGEPGCGRMRAVKIAFEGLEKRAGLKAEMFTMDCSRGQQRFLGDVALLIENVICSGEETAGQSRYEVLKRFYEETGNDPVLKKFISGEGKTGDATWRSVCMALIEVARKRNLDRLVLVFRNVSKTRHAELGNLTDWHEELLQREESRLRLVVTSEKSGREMGLKTSGTKLERFTDQECRDLIGRVFIMPPARETMCRALIEKSERIPANLNLLLKQLSEQRERLLDFEHPHGVQILDLAAFQQLATSVGQVEKESIAAAVPREMPRTMLACLSCIDGDLSEPAILQVFTELREKASKSDVGRWIGLSQEKYGWIEPNGDQFRLRSTAIRLALSEVAGHDCCAAVHRALYTLHKNGKRPCADWLGHLAAAPLKFIRENGGALLDGLRESIGRENFSAVKEIMDALSAQKLQLANGEELAWEMLRQELKWEENGRFDEPEMDALMSRIREHASNRGRTELEVRGHLLFSRFHRRNKDFERAIAVAEQVERKFGPWRWLPVDDADLQFQFALNLWATAFEALEEKLFVRVDTWIWKQLRKKKNDGPGTRKLASFLSLYMDFLLRYPNEKAREEHFPVQMGELDGRAIPLAANEIEKRTRVEKITASFVNQQLSNANDQNLGNTLLLARLYRSLGLVQWQSLPVEQRLRATGADEPATDKPMSGNGLSLLQRAEEIFDKNGFTYDVAVTQHKIGETYFERVQLLLGPDEKLSKQEAGSAAQEVAETQNPERRKGDEEKVAEMLRRFQNEQERRAEAPGARSARLAKPEVKEQLILLCAEGERWLDRAARGYDSNDLPVDSTKALEQRAELLRCWSDYQAEKVDDAIRVYQELCARPAIRKQPKRWDQARRTLIQLFLRAKREREAERVLEELGTPEAQALIAAEKLADERSTIAQETANEYQEDLAVLKKCRGNPAEGSPGQNSFKEENWICDEKRLVRAIAVLACRLAEFHWSTQSAAAALDNLREAHAEITAVSALEGSLRAVIIRLLPELWHHDANAKRDLMVQDFTRLVVPLVNEETWPEFERFLGKVWERSDKSNEIERRLAALDMSLILCEKSLERRGGAARAEALSRQTLDWFYELAPDHWEAAARLLARALAIVLKMNEVSEDDQRFRFSFRRFHTAWSEAGENDAVLRMLVHLVELVMNMQKSSRKTWYARIVRDLAEHLQPAQRRSSHQFEDMTRLVQLYVQLPKRSLDAVDVIERQCERLLDGENQETLARYLSFLSDLLSSALSRESRIAGIEQFFEMADHSNKDGGAKADGTSERDPRRETGRTTTLRSGALQLCRQVIGRLGHENLGRSKGRSVLYNAAKLIEGDDTGDLRCAVYAKLHTMASGTDGANVWGVYTAWADIVKDNWQDFLEDSIALTSFANITAETADGEVTMDDSTRNYLITTQTRNRLLNDLCEKRPKDEGLLIAYGRLEWVRLSFLDELIEGLVDFIGHYDEFKKLEFLKFLYGYVLEKEENMPIFQMIERIQGARPNVRQAMNEVNEQTSLRLSRLRSNPAYGEELVQTKVFEVLKESRGRGQELMEQLGARIHGFSLKQILGDVQRQLNGEKRSIDFHAALGLEAPDPAESMARRKNLEQRYARQMLKMEPAAMLPMLLAHGQELLSESEGELAERFYRRALELAESLTEDTEAVKVEIFRGLMRSLSELDRLAEARDFGERAIAEFAMREGPIEDWLEAEDELADVILRQGDRKAALDHLRSAVNIAGKEREQNGNTIRAQENLAGHLEESADKEELQEASTIRSEILDILRAGGNGNIYDICSETERLIAVLDRLGQKAAGEEVIKEAINDTHAAAQQYPKEVAYAQMNLAELLLERDRCEEAEALLRESRVTCATLFGAEHPETARAFARQARALMRCGKLEEAGECAHQAIEVCRANSPRRTPLGIETSPSAEALMELRTLAGDYYTQGHLEKAESLLRELIAQDFEPCSNQLHIARLMLLTDRIVEAWEIVEEAALSSAEAPNYVLARLLWFQLALTLLDPARAADGKGEKTETLLGRLKTLLQEPDVVSEWWMQPVIDHLRARIETQACNLLTALFTALNSPGQLALLESFPEWRDQPAVPLDAR